jgi:3-deoxy-D-manno-octulosonic-acid transferase
MYFLYTIALCAYGLLILPLIAVRAVRRGKSVGTLSERLGRLPAALNPDHRRSIWIHAVSVGEAIAARGLLKDLREAYPTHRLLLSTTTVTGQAVARTCGDAVDGVFYAPLDLMPFVTRALDRIAPDLLVVVDTELWPNLLRACHRRGVRTAVVNGRMSPRAFRRYRLVGWLMRRVFVDIDHVCAQSTAWGRHYVALGLPAARLTVTGSLKFDALDVTSTGADLHVGDRALCFFTFAADRPVVMAASTLRGEEEAVLRAFRLIRTTSPDAVLVIAPRHPERFDEVHALAGRAGFTVARRTSLEANAGTGAPVIVLDTIGELARLFQIATVVFVGGSLVPAGGHNILEPAVFGKPIVFGPHMENFTEIADLFLTGGAACQVQTADELPEALGGLLADPVRCAGLGAAARALVDANRGARRRSLEIIATLLPPQRPVRTLDDADLRVVW